MRIGGKPVKVLGMKTVVIPRGDDRYVFKLKPVTNYDIFDSLCPKPKPQIRQHRDGRTEELVGAPEYQKELEVWAQNRYHWSILESLSATEDLEFDSIDMQNPETWTNWQQEFRESGFSDLEVSKILDAILQACGLDSSKIDEATNDFLAGENKKVES